MPKKHVIAPDFKLNPKLKDQISSVRGGMVGAAEKYPIPSRFQVTPDENDPSMWIEDTETGHKTQVSLYAYGNVRKALTELFPNP